MQLVPAPKPEDLTDVSKTSLQVKVWHHVAVRMADEGIPLRAIVRTLMLPFEEVRETLEDARDRGIITTVPREEWPPGMRRDERTPDTMPLELEDDHMTMLAMRTFKVTSAEAKVLIVLLRRTIVSKLVLHNATLKYDIAGTDDTSGIKIVDVYICKLRKKLAGQIVIETIWGVGYSISAEDKAYAFKTMGIHNHELIVVTRRGVHLTEHKEQSC